MRPTHQDENPTIERYRSIIPDWERFMAASARPLPYVVRVNTLRISPELLIDRLRSRGIEGEPIPWEPTLIRLDRPPGRLIEHWLGLFYAQEAVQALPVLVLDPRPNETILDLCAAPGGKATHIAARMENTGCLVANEPSGRRQQGLLANINRLGVVNATITDYRGESFPTSARFDRVLVDAPCSAEGTLRKARSLQGGARKGAIHRLSRLQKRLVLRAYDLLRPGGILVYSTCTFAPEENEAVIAHLLSERDGRIAPISLPFSASPGLTEWLGERFGEEMAGCARIYPHEIDSGGGFIARIERPR